MTTTTTQHVTLMLKTCYHLLQKANEQHSLLCNPSTTPTHSTPPSTILCSTPFSRSVVDEEVINILSFLNHILNQYIRKLRYTTNFHQCVNNK